MGELSQLHREILHRYMLGQSRSTIASALGLSYSTVSRIIKSPAFIDEVVRLNESVEKKIVELHAEKWAREFEKRGIEFGKMSDGEVRRKRPKTYRETLDRMSRAKRDKGSANEAGDD